MTTLIKQGRRYVRRDGKIAGPMELLNPRASHSWIDPAHSRGYDNDGKNWSFHRDFDLLTELEEPSSPESVEGWRLIESAPKDNRILGCDRDGRINVTWYGKTSHVAIYGWCWMEGDPEDVNLWGPTHWMPLPIPPSSKDKENTI
jgi:hypothetical protein